MSGTATATETVAETKTCDKCVYGICPKCQGDQTYYVPEMRTCPHCHGPGKIWYTDYENRRCERKCTRCDGRGEALMPITYDCDECTDGFCSCPFGDAFR